MLVLGLTGGIGSGKSFAAECLRRRGAAIVDADEIAREVVRPGSPVIAALAEAFGPEVVRPDGGLDRARLARTVFGKAECVARLNAITHPPIVQETDRRLARLREEGKCRVACLVAPLLVEAGLQDRVDKLLVLTAEEEERIRRVVARYGVTREEVRRRIAAQLPSGVLREAADWVVDTTQGRANTQRQLEAIWRQLTGSAVLVTGGRDPDNEARA